MPFMPPISLSRVLGADGLGDVFLAVGLVEIASFNKGEIASCNYSLEIDYLFYDLVVRLDGNVVSATGNITMDRNHTLSASAVGFWKKK
jgi:hypothetical protein